MVVTEAQVLEALRAVEDPDLHRDIVSLGFIRDLSVGPDFVSFTLELTTPACPVRDILEQQARAAVMSLGVSDVRIEMTARVRERDSVKEDLIPEVRHCIAIASGKGGVGKSTITLNLAIALAQTGATVGLMDADVYGPSIPLMMGAKERPMTSGGKILPIELYGVSMMSLGLLLEEGQAVLWRGPMVAGTVRQLLADVAWGPLDYLLVDLPPGTGDAPMSLAQIAPLTGVVLVTTPDHVASQIAGKSVQLFRRLGAPIIGLVENMGDFACPSCGEFSRVFSGTTGEQVAALFEVPFLGSIPLDPAISAASDAGVPAIVSRPERPAAEAFRQIAGALAAQASIVALTGEPEPDVVTAG